MGRYSAVALAVALLSLPISAHAQAGNVNPGNKYLYVPIRVTLPAPVKERLKQQSGGSRSAQFWSHEGTVGFLAAGVLLPLLTDGRDGRSHSIRTFDALATSSLLSLALKAIVRAPRPDTGERDSFPSGHATAAFSVATMQTRYHHAWGLLWVAGAALIADSRVRLGRHRPADVIAGAALGTGTALGELRARRGLIVAPFVGVDERDRLTLGFGGRF